MPVRALVDAGRLFGIAENAVRVALARLRASGQVESTARGRYRIGAAAAPVEGEISGWRRVERRIRSWDGGWLGVLSPTGTDPGHDRALRLLGFQELRSRFRVRPDNLTEGTDALRRRLRRLGMSERAIPFSLRSLDDTTSEEARGLWDGDRIRSMHADGVRRMRESERRLSNLSREAARAESFLLGGEMIRQIVLDPLLPEALSSGSERRALVEALRHYDRVGRGYWSEFLRRYDVPHRWTPMHLPTDEVQGVLATGGL